uniref:Transcriptional regulator n=1 Tax=Methanococcus maripaludis (strain C6 / ATCC BAA-1332) TaxID=444158 RepID=A9A9G5_METM6
MRAHERLLLSVGSDKFTDEFKKVLLELDVPLKEFSEISEIPYSTLYKITNEKDFRVSTLKKIINTVKSFEEEDSSEEKIALIAARPSLNKISTKRISVNGKTYLLKEYPASTLEDCIVSAIYAEREGVKAIVCAPIVSTSIEKVVRIPVAVIIAEKNAFMEALEIVVSKI